VATSRAEKADYAFVAQSGALTRASTDGPMTLAQAEAYFGASTQYHGARKKLALNAGYSADHGIVNSARWGRGSLFSQANQNSWVFIDANGVLHRAVNGQQHSLRLSKDEAKRYFQLQ
jgi:hypothetical protein